MQQTTYDELGEVEKKLLDAAEAAMEKAYSPYSKFKVGAALLTLDGTIITGVNVENASYGLTNCAERTAIFKAVSEGYTQYDKIAIIASGEDFDTTKLTPPCGACRQVIYEFSQVSGKDLDVIVATTKKDKVGLTTIGQLLPGAFGPADLDVDVTQYRQ